MKINDEKLYRLKIYICTDGDYYYENSLLGKEDEEHIIYYDERDKATQTLKNVYEELARTIESSLEHMQDTVEQIKKFGKYLPEIADRIPTFCIKMPMGNQEINIELVECEEAEFCDGKTYKEHNPNYTFRIYNDFEEAYNWNVLNDIPAVK